MQCEPYPHHTLPSNSQNQDNFATFDPRNLHLNLHSLPQLQKITTQSQTQTLSLSLSLSVKK